MDGVYVMDEFYVVNVIYVVDVDVMDGIYAVICGRSLRLMNNIQAPVVSCLTKLANIFLSSCVTLHILNTIAHYGAAVFQPPDIIRIAIGKCFCPAVGDCRSISIPFIRR